jgi:hypothetical protein
MNVMKPGRTAAFGLALVITALLAVVVAGQQPPASPPAPQSPDARQPTAAEVQTLFDAMVVVQAQKALDLTDAQYPQFVGRLKALQDARRRGQRGRAQILLQLQRLTNRNNAAADDAQLRTLLRSLDDLQERTAADVRKAYENLDQALDLRQQARFRVFEEQIERRKFEFLLNARRRARTQAGTGRGR